MSEISKAIKSIDSIEAKFAECGSYSSMEQFSENISNEIRAMSSDLRSVYRPQCDKFIKKSKEVDPVTQSPRYGPAMVMKINDLSTKIDVLIAISDDLMPRLPEIASSSPKDDRPVDTRTDAEIKLFQMSTVFAPSYKESSGDSSSILLAKKSEEEKTGISSAASELRREKAKQKETIKQVCDVMTAV
jgi:hypothetical protein